MHPRFSFSPIFLSTLIVGAWVLDPSSLTLAQSPTTTSTQESIPALTGTAKLRADAESLRPLFPSPLVQQFLNAVPCLPDIGPRTLYIDTSTRRWKSKAEVDATPESGRAALKEREIDFYETKYGTPLAYCRAFEVLARAPLTPPFASFSGMRILDFGYGGIGHLRLLAAVGATPVGVDVDPMLPLLYDRASDLAPAPDSPCPGRSPVTLVDGQFPAGPGVADQVGTGFDLFISKNTLKRGYIHPERPVEPRMLVHLGVPDEGFLHALRGVLKPGGVALIYNLCPAPAPDDKPYIPWADGRCPFPRDMWEKAGFRVIAFDVNDDAPARAMARALGWDSSGMDVDHDLFAWYSVFQRE